MHLNEIINSFSTRSHKCLEYFDEHADERPDSHLPKSKRFTIRGKQKQNQIEIPITFLPVEKRLVGHLTTLFPFMLLRVFLSPKCYCNILLYISTHAQA